MCINHFMIHLEKVFNVFFSINVLKESDSNFANMLLDRITNKITKLLTEIN